MIALVMSKEKGSTREMVTNTTHKREEIEIERDKWNEETKKTK